MHAELYNSLAALLSYPERLPLSGVILSQDTPHGERPGVGCERGASESKAPCASDEITAFASLTSEMSLHELQELFIQTFDLNPVCSLEMGWHLFGENYDRGLLLVKIRQQLRAFGIAEGTELPDHLATALRLLARMEREEAAYFAEAIVLPSVGKMLDAFRGKTNPYEHILNAVRLSIREEFPNIPEYQASETGPNELRVLA